MPPLGTDAMKRLLEENDLVLMEAAIVERLRRDPGVDLHPQLVHAPLIYQAGGRQALAALYREYMDVAAEAGRPLLICTPTWRADRARVDAAGVSPAVNRDAVAFLQTLRGSRPEGGAEIRIGGLIGCCHDCYRPEEALSALEAEGFHAWQIGQLARAGCDFLLAETLPSVAEAVGIARAMEKTALPYLISFVIGRDGRILDGTDLPSAVTIVDSAIRRPPLGFMVNCAYPTFLCADDQPAALFKRLIGYQANASSLDHCELDGAETLHAEALSEWGDEMLRLNRSRGVKILGGCCGTGSEHLRYLVSH